MGLLSGILGGKDEIIPSVDKKTVEKALKEVLWPLLKQHGFQTFKGRRAWRHAEKRIDVVEIQFFPKEKAEQWGITPYSFALPVGCYFPFVPHDYGTPVRCGRENNLPLPEEMQCHLRKDQLKTLKQRESKIPNVWYIDPKGKYLSTAVEDAKNLFEREVFIWFERFDDLSVLLRTLIEIPRADLALGLTLGFPRRLTAFLAIEVGEWRLAKKLLQQEQEFDRNFFNPEKALPSYFDDKVATRIAKAKAAYNDALIAGIAKAEAELRGSA